VPVCPATPDQFGFTDTLIFADKFVLFSLRESVFVTVIENRDITQTMRTMFEWTWKSGFEPEKL
jgi:hypothetical protein